MSDKNLSVRAGLNVGIEPSLLPWTRAAGGKPILVDENGDTLLMVASDKSARLLGSGASVYGWLFADPPPGALVEFEIVFVDELGNEIIIGGTPPLANPVNVISLFGEKETAGFNFCLAPGEKIIGRLVSLVP